MAHQYAVWSTPVAPVSTHLWDTAAWERFEDRYRPEAYTGDRHDQAAWAAYLKSLRHEQDEVIRLRWYKSLLRTVGPERADRWLALNREANP